MPEISDYRKVKNAQNPEDYLVTEKITIYKVSHPHCKGWETSQEYRNKEDAITIIKRGIGRQALKANKDSRSHLAIDIRKLKIAVKGKSVASTRYNGNVNPSFVSKNLVCYGHLILIESAAAFQILKDESKCNNRRRGYNAFRLTEKSPGILNGNLECVSLASAYSGKGIYFVSEETTDGTDAYKLKAGYVNLTKFADITDAASIKTAVIDTLKKYIFSNDLASAFYQVPGDSWRSRVADLTLADSTVLLINVFVDACHKQLNEKKPRKSRTKKVIEDNNICNTSESIQESTVV